MLAEREVASGNSLADIFSPANCLPTVCLHSRATTALGCRAVARSSGARRGYLCSSSKERERERASVLGIRHSDRARVRLCRPDRRTPAIRYFGYSSSHLRVEDTRDRLLRENSNFSTPISPTTSISPNRYRVVSSTRTHARRYLIASVSFDKTKKKTAIDIFADANGITFGRSSSVGGESIGIPFRAVFRFLSSRRA